MQNYIGIDIGSETVKIIQLKILSGARKIVKKEICEHQNEPMETIYKMLQGYDWPHISSVAVTGKFSKLLNLPRIPSKHAQTKGFKFLVDDEPATIISIGAHGFSVLEIKKNDIEIFHENSRCSQGTGNFLRQLVERFHLTLETASEICEKIKDPSKLSGRCPVILKTDMTHAANSGEDIPHVLAGLYDAICSNVKTLIKPSNCPGRVFLIGGVSRSKRIRENIRKHVEKSNLIWKEVEPENALFFEAIGAAVFASEQKIIHSATTLKDMFVSQKKINFDIVPSLSASLSKVRRLQKSNDHINIKSDDLIIIGLDIGSTGSKLTALDLASKKSAWENYVQTNGNPVKAAQKLIENFLSSPVASGKVIGFGITGSGREIVGSLMTICFGSHHVYILNEIAAHAEGALYFDSRVDTIFEIGGQDAKYIRLSEGKIIDSAMNEARSAGTGSFIEEQGKKFQGFENINQLSQIALEADYGISLGQHCSVFMAEIIDEAVASGCDNQNLIAGIYDSIILNYLNRVKGNRLTGKIIFCQGMPFASDALAAAAALRTGSEIIIPPNPGTVGALGISLLSMKNLDIRKLVAIDLNKFLTASVFKKDIFTCKSNQGCGDPGDQCRIDRIFTRIQNKNRTFTWGGNCSLWVKTPLNARLPDKAPDPFKERELTILKIVKNLNFTGKRKKIAITDEFHLKGLFPYFITFLEDLGFDITFNASADQSDLKRGIENANIPFCAPMQLYHGIIDKMLEVNSDFIFLPIIRNNRHMGKESHSVMCSIPQGSADIIKWDLRKKHCPQMISPVIDIGFKNYDSPEFLASVKKTAKLFGKNGNGWRKSHEKAKLVQLEFEKKLIHIGQNSLDFCDKNNIISIVVLGRDYTIYNSVLNSNVPKIIREQGFLAIPVDCYQINENTPYFKDMYWGYGQRNLRAAHQIRREKNTFAIWCSNYSCGPDSFILHFFSYIMTGKPYAIIETDGHTGDAGTKTRIEAFLHCIREDLRSQNKNNLNTFEKHMSYNYKISNIVQDNRILLIPRMGVTAEAMSACLKGAGIQTECLNQPDWETLRLGRKYTSGKECTPMTITLGSLLNRLKKSQNPEDKFAFFMPTANGPCRFGVYNLLQKIILEQLNFEDKVKFLSPDDTDYFQGLPAGFSTFMFTAFIAADILLAMLLDTRPVEKKIGEAKVIYKKFKYILHAHLENPEIVRNLSGIKSMTQINHGDLYGMKNIVEEAAHEFKAIKTNKVIPFISLAGETYTRCDPFANDFIIDKIEDRGIGVRIIPTNEWLEYTNFYNKSEGISKGVNTFLSELAQNRIRERIYQAAARILDWPERTTVKDALLASNPYLNSKINVEAVLTLGNPLHDWRSGYTNGVISVGPHECLSSKLAEAQYYHAAEKEGIPALSIPYNGDPIDNEIIDNFVFEVQSRFYKNNKSKHLLVQSLS